MRSTRGFANPRLAGFVAALLTLATVTATPVAWASPPGNAMGDLAVAGPHGGFRGEGYVTAEPDPHQLAEAVVHPGRSVWFDVALRNIGGSPGTFDVHGTGDGDGFEVRYYDQHFVEVTADVVAGIYQVPVGAGRRASMAIEVEAPPQSDTGEGRTIWLRASAAGGTDLVRARVSVPPRRVWAVSYDGRARCTATFPHRILQPGRRTGVKVTLTNVTNETITVSPHWASMVFRDAQGGRLGDSIPPAFVGGPAPMPVDIAPGRSIRVLTWDAVVRWSGPVSVKVLCTGGRFAMPEATFDVAVPTPRASIADAIDAAVDVPGSPWQACRPGPAGEPSIGILPTPEPTNIPDITVRCWASFRQEDGFDVVDLHLVSPDDAPAYTLGDDDPFSIDPVPPDDAPNYLAVRWGFVVTAGTVRPYSSGTQVKALGTGKTSSYQLTNGKWHGGSRGPCGYWGISWWPTGSGVLIDWIAGCVQTERAKARRMASRVISHVEHVGARFELIRRAR